MSDSESPKMSPSDLQFPRKCLPLKIINLRRLSQEKHVMRIKTAYQQRQKVALNGMTTFSLTPSFSKSPFTIKDKSQKHDVLLEFSLSESRYIPSDLDKKCSTPLKNNMLNIKHKVVHSKSNECFNRSSMDTSGRHRIAVEREKYVTPSDDNIVYKSKEITTPKDRYTNCISKKDANQLISVNNYFVVVEDLKSHRNLKALQSRSIKESESKDTSLNIKDYERVRNPTSLKDNTTTTFKKIVTPKISKIPIKIWDRRSSNEPKRASTPECEPIESMNKTHKDQTAELLEKKISEMLNDSENDSGLTSDRESLTISNFKIDITESCARNTHNHGDNQKKHKSSEIGEKSSQEISPITFWLKEIESVGKSDSCFIDPSPNISGRSIYDNMNVSNNGFDTNFVKKNSKASDNSSEKSDSLYVKDYGINLDLHSGRYPEYENYQKGCKRDDFEWEESEEEYLSESHSNAASDLLWYTEDYQNNNTPYNLRFPRSWGKRYKNAQRVDGGLTDDSLGKPESCRTKSKGYGVTPRRKGGTKSKKKRKYRKRESKKSK